MDKRFRIWLGLALVVGLCTLLAIFVLNVSKVGPVEGCPVGCADSDNLWEGSLRLLSFNMLHGFPDFDHLDKRLEMISAEIQRQGIDIALLQEVPWTVRTSSAASFLAERTDMNFVYLPANGNRRAILFSEGEAVLSKFPLEDIDYIELQPQAGFFEHRVALKATAVTPWGRIAVVSTHLTDGEAQINQQHVASLADFVTYSEGLTTLVGGDFNTHEETPQIRTLAEVWMDVYRTVHARVSGYTCCIDDLNGAPGEPLEERIDYIFLVPGANLDLRILDSYTVLDQPAQTAYGWQWASDHVGLIVTLGLAIGHLDSSLTKMK